MPKTPRAPLAKGTIVWRRQESKEEQDLTRLIRQKQNEMDQARKNDTSQVWALGILRTRHMV